MRIRQLNLFMGRRQKGELPPPPLEFAVCCAFADTLRVSARPDWFFTHFPSGEMRPDGAGARLKRLGTKAGVADYLFISPQGCLHCLEFKRGRLGRLSENQIVFRNWCLAHSVPHAVARTYDEAIAVVANWGVMRFEVKPQ